MVRETKLVYNGIYWAPRTVEYVANKQSIGQLGSPASMVQGCRDQLAV